MNGEASTAFITNLFEGIDALKFHDTSSAITHLLSKEGEEVCLAIEVPTRGL